LSRTIATLASTLLRTTVETFDTSVIVFDLQEVPGTKSRLDVFRLLLDFTHEMREEYSESVELAYRGDIRFKIDGSYFRTLGRERNSENPVYTIRTFPENVQTPGGMRAHPECMSRLSNHRAARRVGTPQLRLDAHTTRGTHRGPTSDPGVNGLNLMMSLLARLGELRLVLTSSGDFRQIAVTSGDSR
jgi:hypothetical protein